MVHDAADVPAGPRRLGSVRVELNEERLISGAGLLVAATRPSQWRSIAWSLQCLPTRVTSAATCPRSSPRALVQHHALGDALLQFIGLDRALELRGRAFLEGRDIKRESKRSVIAAVGVLPGVPCAHAPPRGPPPVLKLLSLLLHWVAAGRVGVD